MALTDLNERRNRKGFAKLLLRSWISSVSIVTKLVAGRPQEWDRLSAEYIQGVPGGKDLTSGECSLG